MHQHDERLVLLHARELFVLPNPSDAERQVASYVTTVLEANHFTVTIDAIGNLLATRGTPAKGEGYPLLSVHLDSVEQHLVLGAQPSIRRALLTYEKDRIHSNHQFILGADDKCGIAIILGVAASTSGPLKLAASVQEEVGCIGIQQVPSSFFANVCYGLVLDRQGACDIVTSIGNTVLCTPLFSRRIHEAARDIGHRTQLVTGGLSDAFFLSRHLDNVVNLSVGYYQPHSVFEWVSAKALLQTYHWVRSILTRLPRTLPEHFLLECPWCNTTQTTTFALQERRSGLCHPCFSTFATL